MINGAIGWITLSNVAHKNALTIAMWVELTRAVQQLNKNPEVLVLVIAGDGENFSTGIDLSEPPLSGTVAGELDAAGVAARAEATVIESAKPVIAAISGHCIGGGMLLALACDLRIASSDARFAITPAKIGAVYPARSIRRLVTQIGASSTKRILFTAKAFSSDEALRIGLIDEITKPADLHSFVASLAETIASRSQLTIQAVKDIVETIMVEPAAITEREDFWRREAIMSPDQEEGIAAFTERRQPRFDWRTPATQLPRRPGQRNP